MDRCTFSTWAGETKADSKRASSRVGNDLSEICLKARTACLVS